MKRDCGYHGAITAAATTVTHTEAPLSTVTGLHMASFTQRRGGRVMAGRKEEEMIALY